MSLLRRKKVEHGEPPSRNREEDQHEKEMAYARGRRDQRACIIEALSAELGPHRAEMVADGLPLSFVRQVHPDTVALDLKPLYDFPRDSIYWLERHEGDAESYPWRRCYPDGEPT